MSNVAIRTALGETFGGDSSLFKALFTLPQTFDARIMSILSGLGINIDTPTADDLAMIANLRLLMKEIDSTTQANRISFIDNLKTLLANPPEKESYTLGYASSPLLAAVGADGGGLDHVEGAGTITVAKLAPKMYSLTVNAVVDACSVSSIARRYRLAISTFTSPTLYALGRMLNAFVSAGSYVVPHIVQIGFTNTLDAATIYIPCQLTIDTTGTQIINGPSVHCWWIDINPLAVTTAGNFVNSQGRFSLSEILIAP